MKITVKLFATFREGREKVIEMELPEATAGFVIDSLKIGRPEVSILLVNGRDGSFNTLLKEGDLMALFPPVGGG